MAEMVLEVSGLTVCREGAVAVENVSFDLAAESDTALIGPNGAGKSSLVQALLGILPHRSGEVRLLGRRLGRKGQLPSLVRDQVAYLPQSFGVRNRCPLSVAEFVGLGWDPAGIRFNWVGGEARRAAVRRALAKTHCSDLADRLISELSGGQTKRVLLAFCVVRPRRLLVLDEAQAGLDSQMAEQFYGLLFDLRRSEGWTVLQVSHDLEMVRRTCDGVLCLNRRLCCSGPPDHALSPSQLERVYGRGFVPYHHRHANPSS
ncbi:metal ABC transporter ATP-binding protein [Synechococcus sp. CS-602]|uniref:metal ABC transporter ATP-binding protein n=1 Tax=Synechococcaceae TaxID=1890426 RepID=UPI0008FF68FA|nr:MULTISPECIES: metal ABC transporter ATP-binding protein [Synechococcaceae]MCT4363840.1 metal ABC transporter ATP-binding protein [Candidatus Regnicoccus frigidus MAG-AL1]APD49039.1 ABC transporter ATP-binding protein [Synechococcus sp. SynAce01]MCT0201657.1 metal ABC transporter ATP-binding protein [Synechococcus sp. CS-603]MCT0203524.1 metal ABC transporter ATP-binding protein [Synechococcus sp. CS-602]MCT0246252.1 metal ABC transporter ATP-binding protein [Synechococcus sp. CS-601]